MEPIAAIPGTCRRTRDHRWCLATTRIIRTQCHTALLTHHKRVITTLRHLRQTHSIVTYQGQGLHHLQPDIFQCTIQPECLGLPGYIRGVERLDICSLDQLWCLLDLHMACQDLEWLHRALEKVWLSSCWRMSEEHDNILSDGHRGGPWDFSDGRMRSMRLSDGQTRSMRL